VKRKQKNLIEAQTQNKPSRIKTQNDKITNSRILNLSEKTVSYKLKTIISETNSGINRCGQSYKSSTNTN
jgi:hypothetical protein